MQQTLSLIWVLFFVNTVFAQMQFQALDNLIESGAFSKAQKIIASELKKPSTSAADRWELNFRLERMERIRKDFTLKEEDALKYIRTYIPEANAKMMRTWEKERSLEMMPIDGKRHYFAQAARNLFRINKEAKKRKIEKEGPAEDNLASFLAKELPRVMANYSPLSPVQPQPVHLTCTYTLTVDKNAVPEGEMIRCWLPFPKANRERQKEVTAFGFNSPHYVIAPDDYLQRTVYMQKPAVKDSPTVFEYSFRYTAHSVVNNIDFSKLSSIAVKPELMQYVSGEAPHIVFTPEIRALSERIAAGETHKGKILVKIFEWIDKNIPWASAREYSTIPNIPVYALTNRHGDCGIQTLLFMTLCRLNGIPAKWQSGWMLHPGAKNLHDWCEIYLDNYGWVPVDQSFGLQPTEDPAVRWFFLGNTDAYHLIVNDGFSKPLFPEKAFPRSETVDFQRGEVEWRGGNLYFDAWDYTMKVQYDK